MEERGIESAPVRRKTALPQAAPVRRTSGQHPGGVVVVPKEIEIYDVCPIQHPADDPDSDIITTHFEYHSIDANLLKLDELGHDDPTIIKHLENLTGVNAQEIPLDDPETMSLFHSCKALKVRGRKTRIPTRSSVTSAVWRCPSSAPSSCAAWSRGDAPVHVRGAGFDFRSVARHGCLARQCRRAGPQGHSAVRLYLLPRRYYELPDPAGASSPSCRSRRWSPSERAKRTTEEMEAAMNEQHVPEWYIDSCKKIKYMFPKAHAVAYVMMAFRIAWFKGASSACVLFGVLFHPRERL